MRAKRESCQQKEKRNTENWLIRKNNHWTLREQMALVKALELFGTSDPEKLAEVVKTRDANYIAHFIKSKVNILRGEYLELMRQKHNAKLEETAATIIPDICESESMNPRKKRRGRYAVQSVSELGDLSPLELWRQIMHNSMTVTSKVPDYSCVLIDLMKKMQVEEERDNVEDDSPDAPDFKALYKFFEDLFSGQIPPKLSPTNCKLICILKEKINSICVDMKEEEGFLKNFNRAMKIEPSDHTTTADDIKEGKLFVPDDLIADYNRHIRVKDTLNPLSIPVYMLKERQEKLTRLFQEETLKMEENGQ